MIQKEEAMKKAIEAAEENAASLFVEGGPFGAVIVKDGQIIAKGKNNVLVDKDPTAHAEIMAIRQACRQLGTHDLSGCTLFTSCMPCPMCLSAIIWANIREVFYANTASDADDIGFRDDQIYRFIEEYRAGGESNPACREVLVLNSLMRDQAIGTFKKFKALAKNIY